MSQLYVTQVPQMTTAQKVITALVAVGAIVLIVWGLSNMKGKKGATSKKAPVTSGGTPQLPDQTVISDDVVNTFRSITETQSGDDVAEVWSNSTSWLTGNKTGPGPITSQPETPIPPISTQPEPLPIKIQPVTPSPPVEVPVAPIVENISLRDLYGIEPVDTGIPLLPA